MRRRESGFTRPRMLQMELPGKRKRGRPQRSFRGVVKEDIIMVGVKRRGGKGSAEMEAAAKKSS